MDSHTHDTLLSVDAVGERHDQLVAWRRHFHQYPELSNQEFETTRFLTERVAELGLRLKKTKLPTGLLAELGPSKGRPIIAVRSDIDALPVLEKTGLPYASKNEGCMHACGHDVHMAVVLGAAAVLKSVESDLDFGVRFLFQPAEELPPGGARPLIEAGALENVGAIVGLHVDPHLAAGRIGLRNGPTMASVYDFDLTVHGTGGHAARPHTAVDAITVAAELIDAIQKVVSRETDPIQPVVVTFGQISGGVARNVIADTVELKGTVRTLTPEAFRNTPKLIRRTANGVCKARGASFEINEIASYPVLSNDARVNDVIESAYRTHYPKRKIGLTDQVLGGEDFACYLEKVPGAMFRLGTMNKKIGADKPWHASDFKVDESAITVGALTIAESVLRLGQKTW